MSTPVNTDLILVNRGGVDYYCPASDWAAAFSGSASAPIGPNQIPIELLVVGGGGAGAHNSANGGGGGGAGRVIWYKEYVITKGNSYAIAVGSGGDFANPEEALANGGNSSFGSIIAGGGGQAKTATSPGGSGGGATVSGTNVHYPQYTKPAIITPTYMDLGYPGMPQGLVGGASVSLSPGGGGGAGGVGLLMSVNNSSGTPTIITNGGPGVAFDITGAMKSYAAGGNGSGGKTNTSTPGSGGNSGMNNGRAGIVIIAYPDTYTAPTTVTGTYTQPTRAGYRVYQWTNSGSVTF